MPNPLLLLVPFAVLASGYAYVLLRGLVPLGVPIAAAGLLAVAFPLLHVVAFGLHLKERGGKRGDVLHWLSYLLLGVFAFAFVLSALRDLGWALAWVIDLVWPFLPEGDARQLWFARLSAGVFALTGVATALGYLEARRRPRVKRVDVPIAGLPDALAGFTIGQLSDVHVGSTIKRSFLQGVVDELMAERPDAIAITGDLVDGGVEDLRHDVAPLGELTAEHGVYFVTGNHEYYSGAEAWVEHVRSLGITPLLNEHVVVEQDGAELVIAGVTDYSAGRIVRHHESDPGAALEGAPAGPRVLLAHQPRSALMLDGLDVDLMLAGHTHGGQFWPWHLFVPLQQPVLAGLDKLGEVLVYTSRGTGYWGPPNRLGSPSEITVLRLIPG